MEVVPAELSGHVDDLTVPTPSSLLYRRLPRKSSDQGEGGESISRPSILAEDSSSSTSPIDSFSSPPPLCAYNLASAKSTPNLLSRIDFLSFYFPSLFFLFLSPRDRYRLFILIFVPCVSFHYSLVSSSF